MEGSEQQNEKASSRYLVQRAVDVVVEQSPAAAGAVEYVGSIVPSGTGGGDLWQDVTTVDVPQRSHRRTVINGALEQLRVADDDLPQFFRALDVDTAEVIPVTIERPPAPPAVRKVG